MALPHNYAKMQYRNKTSQIGTLTVEMRHRFSLPQTQNVPSTQVADTLSQVPDTTDRSLSPLPEDAAVGGRRYRRVTTVSMATPTSRMSARWLPGTTAGILAKTRDWRHGVTWPVPRR